MTRPAINPTWCSALAGLIGLPRILPPDPTDPREAVILLHGLLRRPGSMRPIERALRREGYQVINTGYPSRQGSIEDLAEATLPRAIAACGNASKIHFVTHSMGAILLRAWAAKHPIPRAGRVVMLAPPNAGSAIVDRFRDFALFRWMNGPAGCALGTSPQDAPRALPPLSGIEVGIIAGSRSLNPLYSSFLEGPDDGKVTVASALAHTHREHLVLPVSHTWMMRNPGVIAALSVFLSTGHFRSR